MELSDDEELSVVTGDAGCAYGDDTGDGGTRAEGADGDDVALGRATGGGVGGSRREAAWD